MNRLTFYYNRILHTNILNYVHRKRFSSEVVSVGNGWFVMGVVRILEMRIVMVACQSSWSMMNFGRMMMSERSFPVDGGLEAVVLVSGVLHGAHVTVGFDEGVTALDDVAVAFLVLALHITSMPIINIIGKVVVWVDIGVVFVAIVL